jgi:endogenous inhibitor of DNA gyrase (YacG/DUF329 family)
MIKVRCPICQRLMQGETPKVWPQFPFCSPRCKLVDLGRWLGEDYRIPSVPNDEEDAAETDTQGDEPP